MPRSSMSDADIIAPKPGGLAEAVFLNQPEADVHQVVQRITSARHASTYDGSSNIEERKLREVGSRLVVQLLDAQPCACRR